MKKTKINLFLIIILCLVFAFTGCSKKAEESNTTDPIKTTDETVTESTDSDSHTAAPAATTESPAEFYEEKGSSAALDVYGGDAKIALETADDMEWDGGDVYTEDSVKESDVDLPIDPAPQVSAGTLTAGEWNDNKNFDFLKNLLSDGQDYNYKDFFTKWDLHPFNRLVISCVSDGTPVTGANVSILDTQRNPIWKGVTDYEGKAYGYYALLDPDMLPSTVKAEFNGNVQEYTVMKNDLLDTSVIEMNFSEYVPNAKSLDLMFVVDTTGSMSDEIYYLQSELENVIKRVQNDTSNIPTRLSVNFYRDQADDYVVRPYEFSTDINTQLAYLNREYANGGGDYEEAVEEALEDAINNHSWDETSIKILFLVLDAPPHNTESIKESLKDSIAKASEMGIRIIPVASSGVDKNTEFLLRTFAMATGGTYTFLTNHSGVGGDHIEPTIGKYEVEFLNDLMVRLIEQYIG